MNRQPPTDNESVSGYVQGVVEDACFRLVDEGIHPSDIVSGVIAVLLQWVAGGIERPVDASDNQPNKAPPISRCNG